MPKAPGAAMQEQPAQPPLHPGRFPDLERCTRDGYQLVMQGLATLVRAAQSEDLKYAIPAGQWLVSYGDGLIREKHARKAQEAIAAAPVLSDRETILAELRGLYAKALGPSQLIVEAEPDSKS